MASIATAISVLLLAVGGGGTMSVTDKTGDSRGAPDLTRLDVGVTSGGLATFRVHVPLPAGSKDGVISVYIDADNNASTGSEDDGGADYVFAHYQSDLTYGFYVWNATAGNWVAEASTVTARHDTTGISFSVNRHALGDASEIRVYAKSAGPVSKVGSLDRLPNSGWISFDLAPFSLSVAAFDAGTARAGGALTLTMAATRSDTGAYVSSQSHDLLTCKATSGGVALPAHTTAIILSNGVPEGTCVWRIAKTLKGKTLHASITETSEGRSITRTVTERAA